MTTKLCTNKWALCVLVILHPLTDNCPGRTVVIRKYLGPGLGSEGVWNDQTWQHAWQSSLAYIHLSIIHLLNHQLISSQMWSFAFWWSRSKGHILSSALLHWEDGKRYWKRRTCSDVPAVQPGWAGGGMLHSTAHLLHKYGLLSFYWMFTPWGTGSILLRSLRLAADAPLLPI